jgi:hypothetical protein
MSLSPELFQWCAVDQVLKGLCDRCGLDDWIDVVVYVGGTFETLGSIRFICHCAAPRPRLAHSGS